MKKSIIDYSNDVKDLERFARDCQLFDEFFLWKITHERYQTIKEEFERDYPDEVFPDFDFPFQTNL